MKRGSLLYVANWKMGMPLLAHAKLFAHQLAQETKEVRDSIIICPSTIHLYPLIEDFKEFGVHFGAQDCSDHAFGAYTGQTSAQSLKETNIQFCIVGHSERRTYFHETNAMIAHKVEQLVANQINPIICIGETEEEHIQKKTFEALKLQLESIFEDLTLSWLDTIYIAYEPVWAIGTGKTADASYIQEIFLWIKEYCANHLSSNVRLVLLYGGSVDSTSAPSLKQIENIGGFLIGSASLDFQKFKKIVL